MEVDVREGNKYLCNGLVLEVLPSVLDVLEVTIYGCITL